MPSSDAACIARLRRAGAVLIGKTNTPEMGSRPTTENELFGATRNPARHDADAGRLERRGGAALAAGIGTLAQGSDGGGSIRIPAACCGVVGHKPTRGLVSGAPATYDAWEGFATNGPMARSVADCALMLEVMAGSEPGDAYRPRRTTAPSSPPASRTPRRCASAYARAAGGQPGCRAGAIFDAVLETLARMGHRLEVADAPVAALMGPFETIVLGQSAGYRQIRAARALGRARSPDPRGVADGERIGVGDYVQAVAEARRARAALLDALAPFELVVSPVLTRPAVPLDEFPVEAGRRECWRAYFEWHSYTVPFNVTGQPALSLPCRDDRRRPPVGLQIARPRRRRARARARAASSGRS